MMVATKVCGSKPCAKSTERHPAPTKIPKNRVLLPIRAGFVRVCVCSYHKLSSRLGCPCLLPCTWRALECVHVALRLDTLSESSPCLAQ